jgi:ATP-dependent helicase HrpB
VTPAADRTTLSPLPIDAVLPALVDALRAHPAVVLRAPAGAGKTTRVPPALLDAGLAPGGRIVMLEPRRIAARTAARRIAQERGVQVGGLVGYQVRFDERVSAATRIVAVTDGILLRRLQDDPFLEGIDAVLFDEFHERRLDSDLALGMVRRVQQTVRPDLKIIAMSATLAAEPIAAYLGNCPVVESVGRLFPVEIQYAQRPDRRKLPQQAVAAVEQVLARTTGDVLVFLPGVGEIRGTARELESLAQRHNLAVMPLYGDLPPEEQDRVLAPCNQRKVVLSTNVAETSITIEGITTVVDLGQARIMRFDPHVGLDRLELTPISKASADQRAGRAGRTQPGICLRLWDEMAHRHRPDFELPEIARVDLSGPVLQLLAWGESDVAAFPWFEPPPPAAIEHALDLLRRLGALDERGVTELGRVMVRLPVQPRLARLIVEGHRLGHPERVALVAALLSERDPFFCTDRGAPQGRRDGPTTAAHTSRSDVVDRLAAFEEYVQHRQKESHLGSITVGAAHAIQRVCEQLVRMLRQELGLAKQSTLSSDEAVMRALLAAYPDRVARRRDIGSAKAVMVGGRGVRLDARSTVLESPLFLCVDIDAGDADAVVRQASAVEREWLPAERLRTVDELFFHPTQKQVVARRRVYFDDLLLEESPTGVPDSDEAAKLLFEAARGQWEQVFAGESAAEFMTRVRCLAAWMPDLSLPSFDREQLDDVLRDLCRGRRSFAELRQAPWLAALQRKLTYQQLRAVETEAPERIDVPSGNRIRLTYEEGRPPVLAVKIQEIFGLRQTPRVAGGRVKVLLHLLAPNMRPQQVTDDLESFWANTYAVVRKELRRRYPKHAWPEDPLTASPTRKAR